MKKTNNKGFSLVELIIVIAIMAILIGVLAPQYIKYVEKSRKSADIDLLDSIYTACSVAASDPEVTDAPQTANDNVTVDKTGDNKEWSTAVLATIGAESIDSVEGQLKSKASGDGDIKISVDGNGNFTVSAGELEVPDADGSNATAGTTGGSEDAPEEPEGE